VDATRWALALALVAVLAVFWAVVILLPKKMFEIPSHGTPLRLLDDAGKLDATLAQLAMDEWKQIVEVQQHFNDLIMRFRTIVLTAFGAAFSILVSLSGSVSIGRHQLLVIGIGLMALMLIAYVIDAGYYFRLLMGAVRAADKFDRSDLAQHRGFFGLTASITRVTIFPWAVSIQSFFYLGPVLVGSALLGWILGPG